MTVILFAILAAATVAIGVLIGSVGIGGVLLVPMLVYFGGIEIHAAIAAAMFAYLFSGAVGAAIYGRRGSIRWRSAAWLCAGAAPAAFAGAAAVSVAPGRALEALIAVMVLLAWARAVTRAPGAPHPLVRRLGCPCAWAK